MDASLRTGAALLLALVIGLTGCSSDAGDGTEADTTTEDGAETGSDDAADDTSDDDAEDTSDDDAAAEGEDPSLADTARCQNAAQAMASAAASAGQAMSTPENAAEGMASAVSGIQAMADAAPSDIAADMQAIAQAYTDLAQALTDSGWDPSSGTAPPAELQAAFEAVDTPELEQASENVGEWFASGCP